MKSFHLSTLLLVTLGASTLLGFYVRDHVAHDEAMMRRDVLYEYLSKNYSAFPFDTNGTKPWSPSGFDMIGQEGNSWDLGVLWAQGIQEKCHIFVELEIHYDSSDGLIKLKFKDRQATENLAFESKLTAFLRQRGWAYETNHEPASCIWISPRCEYRGSSSEAAQR